MSKGSGAWVALAVGLGMGAAAAMASTKGKASPKAVMPLGQAPAPILVALGPELLAAEGPIKARLSEVPVALRHDLGLAPLSIEVEADMLLAPRAYELRLRGLCVAKGRLAPEGRFAVTTGAEAALAGEKGTHPVDGRRGVWIDAQDEGQARLFGHDVLEPEVVLAQHLDAVLRRHLHEFLTREETHAWVERAKGVVPRTTEELTRRLELGTLQRVLQALVQEGVSLADWPHVLELLVDAATRHQEPAALVEEVRVGLARQLCLAAASADGLLHVIPLGPHWEAIRAAKGPEGPGLEAVRAHLARAIASAQAAGHHPLLVAPNDLRAHARLVLGRHFPELPILSEAELDPAIPTASGAGAPAGVA